jgi:hypothetical protein
MQARAHSGRAGVRDPPQPASIDMVLHIFNCGDPDADNGTEEELHRLVYKTDPLAKKL